MVLKISQNKDANIHSNYDCNMQIIDEKSLIKKYQNEIRCLKEELEQLKRGIVTVPQMKDSEEDDIVRLKQKV